MRFRQAVREDLPAIMTLIHEAQAFMAALGIDQWQDGYPTEDILREDIRIGQLYVLASEDAVGAVAALSLLPEPIYDALEGGAWLNPGRYLTIHRMALSDACRGSGLAGRMLEQAAAIARREGCGSIRADTHTGNAAMRRFLEKNGFLYTGTVRYPVTAGDPVRVAYEKLLA